MLLLSASIDAKADNDSTPLGSASNEDFKFEIALSKSSRLLSILA